MEQKSFSILDGISGKEYVIDCIKADEELSRHLHALGLTSGQKIFIESKANGGLSIKVNNTKLMKEEVEQWLDELDIIDSRVIKKSIEKLDSLYGFVEQIKTKCPNCGNEVKHGLPITNELFDPSK